MTRSGGALSAAWRARGGVGRLDRLEFRMQRQLLGQRLAQVGVVVDNQDSARLGHGKRVSHCVSSGPI